MGKALSITQFASTSALMPDARVPATREPPELPEYPILGLFYLCSRSLLTGTFENLCLPEYPMASGFF